MLALTVHARDQNPWQKNRATHRTDFGANIRVILTHGLCHLLFFLLTWTDHARHTRRPRSSKLATEMGGLQPRWLGGDPVTLWEGRCGCVVCGQSFFVMGASTGNDKCGTDDVKIRETKIGDHDIRPLRARNSRKELRFRTRWQQTAKCLSYGI